ncbi:hypothetical protein REPUB_Repub06bG0035600 [Reevesia pubescens]
MAEEQQRIQIPNVKLGTQGLEVSKLGFGCSGLSGAYNNLVSDDVGISVIKHAFERGITFFDTSDSYGPKTNEILVGKALQQLPREKVQLATKFGIAKKDSGGVIVNGTPEYVRASVEASLKRLDVEYIDLYYQHRVDTNTPIEDTMEELKKLVEEGKIKYIGLSEASPETIKRAHAVHPITAGTWNWDSSIEPSWSWILWRQSSKFPKVSRRKLGQNKILYLQIEKLAQNHGCTPAQLALAWLLHQADDVAPIPGTTKIKNLDSNIDSLRVRLIEDDLKEITAMIPINQVAGTRSPDRFSQFSWKSAKTPPKENRI